MKIKEISQKSENFSQENRLLSQFLEILENKSPEILKKFSIDFLNILEKNLNDFLQSIKNEKFLKAFSINLQGISSEKYSEIFKITKESPIFLDFLRDTQNSIEKKTEKSMISAPFLKELFFKELNFQAFIPFSEENSMKNVTNDNNLKEILSQINIKDGNIDSFQTYFEKEHKKDSEFLSENDSKTTEEPFEVKLAELQRNFFQIKEKIKEKAPFINKNFEKRLDLSENTEEIEKSKEIMGFYKENKENMNFSRREMSGKTRKIADLKSSVKKNQVFERHLEFLKGNNKN